MNKPRTPREGTQIASRTTRRAGASLRAHERNACARARRNPSLKALLVAEFSVPSVLFGVPAGSGRCSLLLLLVHLRVVAAIVTIGRHHHRALSSEGLGHRLALPAAAPTHRTLLDASQQGAQPLPDRSWRAPCGRWASSASFASIPDALKQACRSSSLEASRSPRPPLSRCCRRLLKKGSPGGGTGV